MIDMTLKIKCPHCGYVGNVGKFLVHLIVEEKIMYGFEDAEDYILDNFTDITDTLRVFIDNEELREKAYFQEKSGDAEEYEFQCPKCNMYIEPPFTVIENGKERKIEYCDVVIV